MSTIFKPTPISNLYELENSTGWIGYLLPPNNTIQHESITLEDSLNEKKYNGVYIFAAIKPNIDTSNFSSSIWAFLTHHSSGSNQRCFLWLNSNPDDNNLEFGQILVFNHDINYLSVASDKPYQTLYVNESIFMAIPKYSSISIDGDSILIKRKNSSVSKESKYGMFLNNVSVNKFIRLGNIDRRGVGVEAPITIPFKGNNSGTLQFDLSFPFTFSKPINYFNYENDQYPYTNINNSSDEYTILETGIKYFYKDNHKQGDTEMMYFLFNQEIPSEFKGSIDFSDIFNDYHPRRTYFAFTGQNTVNKKKTGNTLLPSNFQTNFGKEIELAPVVNFNIDGSPAEDSSLLVFSDAVTIPTSHKKRYYWVPQGEYTLNSVTNATAGNIKQMLLCGISGTETIDFYTKSSKYAGDRISFTPKQPAYSKKFITLEDSEKNTVLEPKPLLANKYTTSWANIVKAPLPITNINTNNYYSQPNQAPLFESGNVSGTLDYAEVPSANLISVLEEKGSFPIATSAKATPVLGLIKKGQLGFYEQKDITLFETEIINPTRKKTIASYYKNYMAHMLSTQATEDNNCPIENLTTTPQGFLVNLNSDKTAWKCLTLANNNQTKPKEGNTTTTPLPLRFKEIDSQEPITGLQNAFQTNEQFLVVSNPDNPDNKDVLDYYIQNFQNQIGIADWPFLLDIAHQNKESNTDAEFTNIMIFKFCTKSIEERIADPKLWTDPTVFNDEDTLPNLIQYIQEYIATAEKSINSTGGENSLQSQGFQQFIDIVKNPNWHGVLSLQVTLNLESLPSEIKAILAGIDTSRFAAHHIGIEANQIKTDVNTGQLNTDFKSSLFGMISYFNTTYLDYKNGTITKPTLLPSSQGNFDFQVLNLQVLFKNSLISDFKSKIQLSMNQAFNELVISESYKSPDAIYTNSIILDGQYDKKNKSTSYTFSVSTPNALTVSSTALDVVTITAIDMATVDDEPQKEIHNKDVNGLVTSISNQDANITTRFIISGNLKFQEIKDFDLFSYDSLLFSNLIIDMEFNLDKINPIDNTPKKEFTFTPNNIVFNRANSITRPNSLVPNFPIELDSLLFNTSSSSENTPITTSSLGYMQVEAPIPSAPVGNTWYALRFTLNMGSLGALAAKVGFNSEVILAWSPGKENNQAQIYAKMPFSGGIAGTNFSIEGVLKFAIGSILFFNDPLLNQYSMIFTEVGVSLLGQKLPPGGSTVLYLFGNPNNPTADISGKSNLGWFGAYKKNN